MGVRKVKLVVGEIYHILNRGVDKRDIFMNQKDLERFFECMQTFNSTELTGSMYEQNFLKDKTKNKPLVNFVTYNIQTNHFHFILEQVAENGISKFMKRLQGGYSWYFNKKEKRSGSLFQGPFKSHHIDSNEYLLHASVYVNLNDKQKSSLGDQVAKLGKSSWNEYIDAKSPLNICTKKDIILKQFRSIKEYEEFALSSLENIKINKEKYKEFEA
ncbi:MAG: transposase [bacterium]|nr:transposase [bacterium]